MNKRELISKTAEYLRENRVKKKVQFPKQTFHISDDEGNKKDFSVRKTDKEVMFTNEDVRNIISACIDVILEALKNGEEISIVGFGTLGMHYRHGRTIGGFDGKLHRMKSHYCPKFWYGKDVKRSVDLYQQTIADENGEVPEPTKKISHSVGGK